MIFRALYKIRAMNILKGDWSENEKIKSQQQLMRGPKTRIGQAIKKSCPVKSK